MNFIEKSDIHKSQSAPQLTSEQPKRVSKYEKDELWKPEETKKHDTYEKKNPLKIYSSESDEETVEIKTASTSTTSY